MISEDDVRKLAVLARLKVDPDYVPVLLGHLNSILDYIARLEKIDTTGVEPMSHVAATTNVFRNDVSIPVEEEGSEVKPGDSTVTLQGTLPVEGLLKNAPDSSGRFIRVPLVIE